MRVSSGMTASSADRGCPATVYPAPGPGNALTGKGFTRGHADGEGPHGEPGRRAGYVLTDGGAGVGPVVVRCEAAAAGATGPDSPVVAGTPQPGAAEV